jgi:hypothetical protein
MAQDVMMPNQKNLLVAATRDTLMNIAGVSGVAAKDLRPGHSLAVDLGFGDIDFGVLAKYQCDVGHRLRRDGRHIAIDPDELRDHMVWQVCALTVERAINQALGAVAIAGLIAQSQASLRRGIGTFR